MAIQPRIGGCCREVGAYVQKGIGWKNRCILDQRRFVRIGARQDEAALFAASVAGTVHRERHRKSAANRAQFAG